MVADFKLAAVRRLFDRRWHKVQLNVLRFFVDLFIDCKQVSMKLFGRNSIKRQFSSDGKLMIGNVVGDDNILVPPKVSSLDTVTILSNNQ